MSSRGGGGGGGGSNYVHVNNIKVLMLISIKEMLKKLFIKFQLKRIYSKIAFNEFNKKKNSEWKLL